MTLQDGILTDSEGRTGYIASNYQFQFDKPPQAGAIYTAGWSICSNGSLTLGDDSVFYQCLSGTFYNLYDKDWAAQCSPIYIQIIGTSGTATTAAASQISDGQITASPQPICEYTDGQPQATNCVSQISDGQVQVCSSLQCSSMVIFADHTPGSHYYERRLRVHRWPAPSRMLDHQRRLRVHRRPAPSRMLDH